MATFRPGKPYFVAGRAASITLPPSVGASPLPFDLVFDSEGPPFYSTSTFTATIPLEGLYIVSLNVTRNVPSSSDVTQTLFQRSGVNYLQWRPPPSTSAVAGNISMTLHLDAGETIVPCYANNALNFGLRCTPPIISLFSIVRIGPKRWTG